MASASVGQATALLDHDPQDLERGHDPVARGGVLEQDDVAALLAAQDRSRHLHPLEDVLVADGGPDDVAAGRLDGRLESAVREHRHDEAAAGQCPTGQAVEGQDAQDLVAVDDPPARIDRDQPVGVAVERETDIRAGRDDGLGQGRRSRRARPDVDVAAVGCGMDDVEPRAGRRQDLRPDRGTRTRWQRRGPGGASSRRSNGRGPADGRDSPRAGRSRRPSGRDRRSGRPPILPCARSGPRARPRSNRRA